MSSRRPLPPGMSPPSLSKSAKAKRLADIRNLIGRSNQSKKSLSLERLLRSKKGRRSPSYQQLYSRSPRMSSPKRSPSRGSLKAKFNFTSKKLASYDTVKRARKGEQASNAAAALFTVAAASGAVAAPILPFVVGAAAAAQLTASLLGLENAFKKIKRTPLERAVVAQLMRSIGFVNLYLKSGSRTVQRNEEVVDTENQLDDAIKSLTNFIEDPRDNEKEYSKKLLMHSAIIQALVQQLMMMRSGRR